MSEQTKQIIRNIVFIIILDMVLAPFGLFIYFVHGFHIFHVVLAFGFIYGIISVFETANMIISKYRIVPRDSQTEISEEEYEEDDVHYHAKADIEPMKPEMEKAMNEVFGIKR